MQGSPIDPARLDELRRSFQLTLDAQGRFLYEGDPLTHPGVVALFKAGLDVTEHGEPILGVQEQWAYLRVEDTPLRVRHVAPEPAQDATSLDLVVTLDDGRTLRIPAETLRDEGDRGLYVEVPSQRSRRPLRARLTNAALAELAPFLHVAGTSEHASAPAPSETESPRATAALRLDDRVCPVTPA